MSMLPTIDQDLLSVIVYRDYLKEYPLPKRPRPGEAKEDYHQRLLLAQGNMERVVRAHREKLFNDEKQALKLLELERDRIVGIDSNGRTKKVGWRGKKLVVVASPMPIAQF